MCKSWLLSSDSSKDNIRPNGEVSMAEADRKLLRRASSVGLGVEAMRLIKVCSYIGQYLT